MVVTDDFHGVQEYVPNPLTIHRNSRLCPEMLITLEMMHKWLLNEQLMNMTGIAQNTRVYDACSYLPVQHAAGHST